LIDSLGLDCLEKMKGKRIVANSFFQKTNIETFEDCKKLCNDNDDCFIAILDTDRGICSLKNQIGDIEDRPNRISYVKGCSELKKVVF